MLISYDPEADAMYVEFRDIDVARTVSVDASRNLDYDLDGVVVGLELLNVRDWLELQGLTRERG